MLRDFTDGAGPVRVPGKDFEPEPLTAVLTSHLSGATAEVQVGQALQRVLLTANGHNSTPRDQRPAHFEQTTSR